MTALTIWTDEQVEVIRKTLAPDASFGELELFASVCRSSGFNPFLKEIYLLKVKADKHVPFVAIDGYRRKGAEYDKVSPPSIVVTWLSDGSAPDYAIASGELLRGDRWWPLVAKVRWVERKPADGKDATWLKMPEGQLSKCAEALYYRMSGCPGLQGLNLLDERHMYEDGHTPGDAPRRPIAMPREIGAPAPTPEPAGVGPGSQLPRDESPAPHYEEQLQEEAPVQIFVVSAEDKVYTNSKTKKPGKYYVIELSDAMVANTFSETLFNLAHDAGAGQKPVKYTVVPGRKYTDSEGVERQGWNLDTLELATVAKADVPAEGGGGA